MKSSLLVNVNTTNSGINSGWDERVRQVDGRVSAATMLDPACLDSNASKSNEEQADEEVEGSHGFSMRVFCFWYLGFVLLWMILKRGRKKMSEMEVNESFSIHPS